MNDPVVPAMVVSLGKPSLKARLEAYYALVAPDQIEQTVEWRSKFELIWSKFGGTHAGEQTLATKLSKKYGTAVRFLTAAAHEERSQQQQQQQQGNNSVVQHAEDWFELNEKERDSGCLDFTSDRFDPVAALKPGNAHHILDRHPHIATAPILDRVDQFRSYLPATDPQFRAVTKPKRQPPSTSASDAATSAAGKKNKKMPSCFAATAALHAGGGPLSVLYRAWEQRQRIRVLTRYIHGIRGTLTGYLIAFDKHMNLILQDVDEHYSPPKRGSRHDDGGSNSSAEAQRRTRALTMPRSVGEDWTLRQRHLRQVLVRGDAVVLVYLAGAERSAFPVTAQSPTQSQYQSSSSSARWRSIPDGERVGTPGSLIYAAQRTLALNRKRDYAS
jgi:small nuclear ribonucleoprotein (snRNP)-like protein